MGDLINDEVVLDVGGKRLDTWTSYSFHSNFLMPTDEWHVTLEHEDPPQKMLALLEVGAKVTFSVNGHIQGTGYIDDTNVHHSRDGGTVISVEGRDLLAQMVDSNQDPRMKFSATSTLGDFVKQCATPFGWATDDQISDTNFDNRGVLTGQIRGIKTSAKGRYLKKALKHRLQPYPCEGAFAFLSRVTQRVGGGDGSANFGGAWVWLSADGTKLIVGQPDFAQEPLQKLTRLIGQNSTTNNIVDGGTRRSLARQPSIIIAQGSGGGGEFPNSKMTRYMQNLGVATDNSKIIAQYPDAKEVLVPFNQAPSTIINAPLARPMFLKDDESKTPEELENFVRREIALRQRASFTAQYTVDGHTQNGIPWAVDTIVTVDDDRTHTHEPLWVMGRTFTKSRSAGTLTRLELIRPYTLVL